MNFEYALEQCTGYLLDILEVPPGPLPERARKHWDDVLKLGAEQRIYHYLAAWMLECWNDALPEELKQQLWTDLEWNKARNAKLAREIIELGEMFRSAGIPVMFLKGSAGLVRGIYPEGWRYISDIDVMVKAQQIEAGHETLLSHGFVLKRNRNFKSHHYGPYSTADNISKVELHIDPYQLNFFSRNGTSKFWNNVETIRFGGEDILVPSLHDWIWILMRTDLLARVCIPRLKDSIELLLLFDKGYAIPCDSILERANDFNIPNVAKALFHSVKRYTGFDVTPGIDLQAEPLFDRWERWSARYRKRNLYDDDQLYKTEKDFAAVRFFPAGSIPHTIGFVKWLLRYHRRMYCYGIIKKCGLYPYARSIKHFMRG